MRKKKYLSVSETTVGIVLGKKDAPIEIEIGPSFQLKFGAKGLNVLVDREPVSVIEFTPGDDGKDEVLKICVKAVR